MSTVRVLIVDDALVSRYLLAEDIASDPRVEVVGTAADGLIALAKISYLDPDVVILDVEMPAQNGLTALAEIRSVNASVPIIMYCARTSAGSTATVEALMLGATDFVAKATTKQSSRDIVHNELIPKIKSLCRRNWREVTGTTGKTNLGGLAATTGKTSPPGMTATTGKTSLTNLTATTGKTSLNSVLKEVRPGPETIANALRRLNGKVEIVTIGVSTGGPNALASFLPCLDMEFPVPIVIVQHMPQIFTALLAIRLSAVSGFQVREGKSGDLLRPGEIYLAPGGYHMEVRKCYDGVYLHTHEGPMENSCRPAADVLFRSVAKTYGPAALAVVLTGMGFDGLRGSACIREAGGSVIVQDEASSVVWGMPGAVSRAGLADKVLPLDKMADEINRRVTGAAVGPLRQMSTRLASSAPLLKN